MDTSGPKQPVSFFDRVAHFFIHPKIQENVLIFQKAKIFLTLLTLVFIFLCCYVSYFAMQGQVNPVKTSTNIIGLAASLASFLLLKKSANIFVPLYLLTVVGLSVVSSSVYFSGGIYSSDIFWLVVMTTATTMFVGRKTGISVLIFSIISILFFYLLDSFEHKDFYLESAIPGRNYELLNTLFILVVTTFMSFILIRGNETLQQTSLSIRDEAVRKQIAQDFHDELGNRLAVISQSSKVLQEKSESGEVADLSKRIATHANEVYENFRDFIWSIDPESDQLDALFMYLKDFGEDLFGHTKVDFYAVCEPGSLPGVMLPDFWSRNIVLIFKEAMTNALKHAQAQQVKLQFTYTPDQKALCISLEDKGEVLTRKLENMPGKGLRNMEARAQQIGCHVKISATDSGVSVRLNGVIHPSSRHA